jgi:hypothetical protein
MEDGRVQGLSDRISMITKCAKSPDVGDLRRQPEFNFQVAEVAGRNQELCDEISEGMGHPGLPDRNPRIRPVGGLGVWGADIVLSGRSPLQRPIRCATAVLADIAGSLCVPFGLFKF